MKKLLLVLLGLSVTLAGCGSLTVDEKEELIDMLNDIDKDDFIEKMEDAKYTKVENYYIEYYVSADFIKGDTIDMDEFEEASEDVEEGEAYLFAHFDGQAGFSGTNVKEVKDGFVKYNVSVSPDGVELSIVLTDEDDEYVTSAKFNYEDGELELDESSDDGSDEFEELLDDHTKKAVKFFEKAFKELYSVMN